MAVGTLAMNFKIRSSLIDPESSDLLRKLEKEIVKQTNTNLKDENQQDFSANIKARTSPQKKRIVDTDIDQKKESLIRKFYDSRKHKRSYTKIKGW